MREPRYKSIVDDFTARIRSGKLTPGTQLPTTRELMRQYSVALATASRVYAELGEIGLVVGETGRGTFVRDTTLARTMGLEQRPVRSGVVDLSLNHALLPGQDEVLRCGLRAMAAAGDLDALLHPAPHGGRAHERQMFARHLRNRGIRVPGSQVLIVNGAQQGLSVAIMAMFQPGDVLAIDELTYPGMKNLAQQARLDMVPVPQRPRHGGMDLDRLEALCRKRPVRGIYIMPTLHNPLGLVMSQTDRLQLAAMAEKYGFIIIEDGAYAFLAEPAPPPIFTLAPQRTIYVCGLSKSVASGLRLGFMAVPPEWIADVQYAIRVSTWTASSLSIALACLWIDDGTVDRLEDGKRKDARRRQTLARRVLKGVDVHSHPSSYFQWLSLPPDMRIDQVAASLERQGILVATSEPFATSMRVPHAMRIVLSGIATDALQDVLRKVRREILG
ncbi:PLP-dependent aminotransferase family protein [Bordetella sp. FB-8]|uniref:aminotransferase-like domain-containing protein n=1 Tax=Bordetella sp. FB-8 TaxID=1159870 RepID=UPI00037AE2CA|nr:PLP-dependent aminotransferase family protein [Bordetella sp. FB-8]